MKQFTVTQEDKKFCASFLSRLTVRNLVKKFPAFCRTHVHNSSPYGPSPETDKSSADPHTLV